MHPPLLSPCFNPQWCVPDPHFVPEVGKSVRGLHIVILTDPKQRCVAAWIKYHDEGETKQITIRVESDVGTLFPSVTVIKHKGRKLEKSDKLPCTTKEEPLLLINQICKFFFCNLSTIVTVMFPLQYFVYCFIQLQKKYVLIHTNN